MPKIKKLNDRYWVAKKGEYVRDKITGKKLIPYINRGYKVITIPYTFRQTKMAILVWTAYHGPIPKGHLIHHKKWSHKKKINTKLKLNDHIKNLQLLTIIEHTRIHSTGFKHTKESKRRIGKSSKGNQNALGVILTKRQRKNRGGENHGNAKLTQKQVSEMRYESWILKIPTLDLMKKYKIGSGIYGIINKKKPRQWNIGNLTTNQLIKILRRKRNERT